MTATMPAASQPALQAAATASAAPTAQQRHAWLREFEQARWDAQPRFERSASPERSIDGPAAASLPAGVVATDTASAPGNGDASHAVSGLTTSELVMRAALHGAPGPATRTANPRQFAAIGPAALGPAKTSEAAPPDPAAGPADVEIPDAGVLPARRVVHVFVGKETTSVWIRDSRLHDEDALRVLNELQADTALGRRPIQLSLNGRPVKRIS